MIDVESVDAEGNGTLLITILDEMQQNNLDGIHQPVDPNRKQVRSSYTQSIPKIRVVVDPHGGFISGEILEEAADHLEFLEMAKRPGVTSHSISDDRRLQLEVEQWFPTLSIRPDAGVGDEWIDTLVESRRVMQISLDRDSKDSATKTEVGATEKNEGQRSQIRRYNSYRIASLVRQGPDLYVKVDGTGIVEQDLMQNMMYVARLSRHDLFRASDGMPVLLKTTGRSGIDGDDGTYSEQVLELLPK